MGKAIVFCADGTWNGPGEPDATNVANPPTNVFKLFLNLAGLDEPGTILLAKEQERVLTDAEGSPLQVAKYLHGVGDSDNRLVQLLGGSVGAGLITRIVRGYTFVSRHYVPGDRIYLTGFSRGAYTARALGGLIAAKGLLNAALLDLDDKDNAYRLGSAVWYDYRRRVARTVPGWMEKLANAVVDLPAFFSTVQVPDNQMVKTEIETVAVWDTVGALGIPQYTLHGSSVDFLQFADTVLSPVVKHGVHAVAVDEQRADFTPTLWQPNDPRIVQVLFPGCHSDVGGGFVGPGVESGLSDIALAWMMKALSDRGVMFLPQPVYKPVPDWRGTAHAPWQGGIWRDLPRGPRGFPTGLWLSSELVQRAGEKAGVIPWPGAEAIVYVPKNLFPGYMTEGLPATGITVV